LLDQLVEDRVNTVSLVFPIYTDNATATSVWTGPDTPSTTAISYFVEQVHGRGIAVMLRPLIDESTIALPGWRGTIAPTSVPAWFSSYQSLITTYGQLAQTLRVEMYDVGTELNSMEAYANNWRELFAAVKAVYHGLVTYSSNWGGFKTTFWSSLDFVSFDAYWPLAVTNPTVSNLAAAWKPALDKVRAAATPFGKPVVFTELGVEARADAYRRPYARNPAAPLDLSQQATYYAAACQATQGVVRGLYWWTVYVNPPADPMHDPSFSPLGKPAEAVMRSCYSAR
jgi:hypothetical protein